MTFTIRERILPYLNKITQGHTVPLMRKLPDDSVDCSVTSPPYWAARIYGVEYQIYSDDPNCPGHEWIHYKQKGRDGGSNQPKRQIKGVGNFQNFDETRPAFCKHCYSWYGELGNEPHFYLFIKHVADIYDEVKRVLKPTGTCWINITDAYFGSGGTFTSKIAAHELMIKWMKKYGYWEEYSRTLKYSKSGYRSKSMCMIPSRLAQELINRGWIVRNEILWVKPNQMPESCKDRLTRKYETVIFLTKSEQYYFDLDAVRQPLAESSIARDKRGRIPKEGSKYYRNIDDQNISNYTTNRGCNPLGKNPGNVWDISTKGYSGDHFAAFSVDLLEIPIRAGCPEYVCKRCGKPREKIIEKIRKTRDNPTKAAKKLSFIGHGTGSSTLGKAKDGTALVSKTVIKSIKWLPSCNCDAGFTAGIVFDPFIGAGTTAIAAKKWMRNFIGFELLADYVKQANERLQSKGNLQIVYGKNVRALFRRKPK